MDNLDDVVKSLHKVHDDLILLKLGDKPSFLQRDRISSGSIGVDRILGGGFVRGSLNQIVGPKSSGKTTTCIHAMVEAQKIGPVLFIDLEHSFDPNYARDLGLDIHNLFLSQPEYAEQAFDVIETMVGSGGLSLVVVDSIPALLPKSELEGDPGDSHMGLAARLNRQHLRRITHPASKAQTTIIYVNQITLKIGIMFGNPETTPGGTGFGYFCSTILDIRCISTMKDAVKAGGIRARVRATKNKTGIPFQQAEFDIKFGEGIDKTAEVFDWAVAKEVIKKSGSWYSYKDINIGQGKTASIVTMSENNNELYDTVYSDLMEGENKDVPSG